MNRIPSAVLNPCWSWAVPPVACAKIADEFVMARLSHERVLLDQVTVSELSLTIRYGGLTQFDLMETRLFLT
jgi:hypothetical protein